MRSIRTERRSWPPVGKLLLYHGWADQLVLSETMISHYEVAKKMGGVSKIGKQIRMFPAGHYGGGEGPNTFDTLTRSTSGSRKAAPDTMIASHSIAGNIGHTRPLCSYPKVATGGEQSRFTEPAL